MNDEDGIYATYLNAFASVRSGAELPLLTNGTVSLSLLAARAMAVSDASDLEFMPAPRWVCLSDVDRLLHSKRPEEAACKVVPMGEAE